ncbi:uncharacterized protein [Miscanthus floridulus]|uniref:uncharacterized protein n=1 Tax=Miscanthus floridulus TaxID=154761 RepID=UPI0034589639
MVTEAKTVPADDMEILELELPHASAKSKKIKEVQKLLYAILITLRKLRHYFKYYKIAVVTEFPLGDILHNKEANGRIIKWAVELSTYSIEFRSRPTIKSQALANFVAEWTEIQEPIAAACPEHWVIYFDGALNINSADVGILFITPTKDKLRYILQIHFLASNNVVEYEACLHGLRIAVALGVKCLMVYRDSALVINQLNKDWSCSSMKMNAYCAEIRKLEGKFYGIKYHHVDLLAPSIKEDKEVKEVPPAKQLVLTVPSPVIDWRNQFIKYLTSVEVPADKTETKCLVHRSKLYMLVDGSLMRKSAKEGILQKCITQEEGVKLLLEIHSGSYGNHAASRTLVGKAFQGLDMIGPFKPVPGGFWYVYVTVDKFSKWIEYKPLVLAMAKKVVDLFEDIIHRFGLPNSIIIDLGATFIGHHF